MPLKFPNDLTEKYYFDLKFKTYSRPDPFSGTINLGEPATNASTGSGDIRLPIPSNIVDTQRLAWKQEENIDGLPGATMSVEGGNSDLVSGITRVGAYELAKAASAGVSAATLGSRSVGSPADLALQKMGLALNPVLTQTFKHPEFKEHHFSWTLAPEDEIESSTLQSIIDTIKMQSLPDIAFGGAFFKYPSIAMIRIFTGVNKNLYNFQPCVVTSFSVNYAPRGVPSWFGKTNAPVMVTLDVTFLEIILNTRKNANGGNVSGFSWSIGETSSVTGAGLSNQVGAAANRAITRIIG